MEWIAISHDNFWTECCCLKKTAEGDMLPAGWYMEFGDSEYRVESNGKEEIAYFKMKEIFPTSHTYSKNPCGEVQHTAEKEAKHESSY